MYLFLVCMYILLFFGVRSGMPKKCQKGKSTNSWLWILVFEFLCSLQSILVVKSVCHAWRKLQVNILLYSKESSHHRSELSVPRWLPSVRMATIHEARTHSFTFRRLVEFASRVQHLTISRRSDNGCELDLIRLTKCKKLVVSDQAIAKMILPPNLEIQQLCERVKFITPTPWNVQYMYENVVYDIFNITF